MASAEFFRLWNKFFKNKLDGGVENAINEKTTAEDAMPNEIPADDTGIEQNNDEAAEKKFFDLYPETYDILNKLKELSQSENAIQNEIITRMLNLKENITYLKNANIKKYDVVLNSCNIERAIEYFNNAYGYAPDLYVADNAENKISEENKNIKILPYEESQNKNKLLFASNWMLLESGLKTLLSRIKNYDEINLFYDINYSNWYEQDFFHKEHDFNIEKFGEYLPEICAIYKNIGDEESRNVFLSVLLSYITGNMGYILWSNVPQYHNKNVPVNEGNIVLDCGCTPLAESDFAVDFIESVGKNGKVYGFDPFYAELFPEKDKSKFSLYKNAVFSSEKTIYFKYIPGASHWCTPDFEGDVIPVNAIMIDKFVSENNIKPDLIKMHLEGGEMEALKGAVSTLKTYRPKLMIAVYHLPHEQFVTIPQFIMSLGLNYKFYYNHAMPIYTETVLFCS